MSINENINIDLPKIESNTSNTLPDKLTARVELFSITTKLAGDKLCVNVGFNVVEPEPYVGTAHWETYWIGGNAEKGSDPSKPYIEGKGYKAFAKMKAIFGLTEVWNTIELSAKVKALRPQALVTFGEKTSPELLWDGSPNKNAGKIVNVILTMSVLGSKPIGLANPTKAGVPAMPKAGAQASGTTIPCPICGEMVPFAEFKNHTAACRAKSGK